MGIIKAIQTAELSASVVDHNLRKYVDLINDSIKPPVPVAAGDIVIRAMYIISDSVNAYGGRFDRSELPSIAALFIDSPVLIGHDKSGLPVARNFWAETVEKDGQTWIKSYFYWLKEADKNNRLKLNIDSGIYKECSVSFTYAFPECSACGGDIRACGHQISRDIFFYYRGVDKILETSLVYRGAVPGTSITDKLLMPESQPNRPLSTAFYSLSPATCLPFDIAAKANANLFRARLNGDNFLLMREGGKA